MRTVLLIEDDTVMRENTAEILELAGYKVHTAPDGKKGCTLAKELQPDIIVCDIMMPELDGYGVIHILSQDPKTSSIPFIFLTAKAERSEARKGMELGADDYLTKPFEDTELLKAIEVRLKKLDALKQNFTRDAKGLNDFLEHAGGFRELHSLSKQCPTAIYNKKQVVFHEGDMPHFLFFLNKGKIKTYKTHEDGKEYITDIASEGDFFGHVALFENKPYKDSTLVLEKSEVCKIPKDDFLSLIYKNRDVANQFIKMLSNKLEGKEEQLLRLAYDSVRKRTAEVILSLKQESSRKVDGKVAIQITREDLGKLVGTTTESVIRCLSELKEDGLVDVRGREIIVLDREGLESIH